MKVVVIDGGKSVVYKNAGGSAGTRSSDSKGSSKGGSTSRFRIHLRRHTLALRLKRRLQSLRSLMM